MSRRKVRKVDWTKLPKEVLRRISHRLGNPFYFTRFRSVCTPWRSSSPNPNNLSLHHPLTLNIPILSTAPTTTTSTFTLSKCTILLISPNTEIENPNPYLHYPNPWLVQITQDPHGQTQFFHPLTHTLLKPTNSPALVDLNNLPVLDLAHGVTMEDTFQFKKVLLMWLGPQKDDFALLAIHISGWLPLFCSNAPNWTMFSRSVGIPYEDICIHEGSFYAIDIEGWLMKFEQDWSFEEVADPVIDGDKCYLLSFGCDLLMLDKFLPKGDEELGFQPYRFLEDEMCWQDVSLGKDTILFLGKDCFFAAQAWDLGLDDFGSFGGFVVFSDDDDKPNFPSDGWRVFRFADTIVSPLSEYPMLSKVFCPPLNSIGIP